MKMRIDTMVTGPAYVNNPGIMGVIIKITPPQNSNRHTPTIAEPERSSYKVAQTVLKH
jgi:hypothetical protein